MLIAGKGSIFDLVYLVLKAVHLFATRGATEAAVTVVVVMMIVGVLAYAFSGSSSEA